MVSPCFLNSKLSYVNVELDKVTITMSEFQKWANKKKESDLEK